MNKFVKTYEIKKELDLLAEADVVVVGGGPGGIGAAVAAAKNGAETILIERFGCPGGMASVGEVGPFCPNRSHNRNLDQPVFREWNDALHHYWFENNYAYDPELGNISSLLFNKEMALLGAEDVLIKAGVKLIYHHTLFDVIMDGRNISAGVFHSKSGLNIVKAKIWIDSTGDGDLAAFCGCDFEYGNKDGNCQPMTLCFKLSHVDKSKMLSRDKMNKIYKKAKADGVFDCPREDLLWFDTPDDQVIHFNTTRVVKKNALEGLELSQAEIEARRQLRQIIDFLRSQMPGFKNAQLHSVANHIGIRESRRIIGIEYLDERTFDEQKKYPDAVARLSYPIDIHNPDGSGTELRFLPGNCWYELPYGCIVPKDVDNLLMGCRAISVDHTLHSSIRVMPQVCSIGQAAGTAAAIASKKNIKPPKIDGCDLRQKLIKMGALLGELENEQY